VKIARVALRLSLILILIGAGLGLVGALLIGTSIYLEANGSSLSGAPPASSDESSHYAGQPSGTKTFGAARRRLATLTPTPLILETMPHNADSPPATATATPTVKPMPMTGSSGLPADSNETEQNNPVFTELDVARALITETATMTGTKTLTTAIDQAVLTSTAATADLSADIALELAEQAEGDVKYVEPYTSTDQVKPPPSVDPTPEAESNLTCPSESGAIFDLIAIEGQPMTDHPDFLHGDLNLSLRGYTPITESLKLVYYNGDTDPNAPRLHGLFEPNRVPQLSNVYQVNEWIWDTSECEGNTRGCSGAPIDEFWPVTLVGLVTTPGELIYTPERGPEIHPGGYVAMVLYAEEQRITLGYTRRDNAASGYIAHLENICVDPNLLALYQAQISSAGWRTSGFLPALRNNQALGVTLDKEIRIAIRDAGSFMDPRSQKDWWN
jgi:hypothetical protein